MAFKWQATINTLCNIYHALTLGFPSSVERLLEMHIITAIKCRCHCEVLFKVTVWEKTVSSALTLTHFPQISDAIMHHWCVFAHRLFQIWTICTSKTAPINFAGKISLLLTPNPVCVCVSACLHQRPPKCFSDIFTVTVSTTKYR